MGRNDLARKLSAIAPWPGVDLSLFKTQELAIVPEFIGNPQSIFAHDSSALINEASRKIDVSIGLI